MMQKNQILAGILSALVLCTSAYASTEAKRPKNPKAAAQKDEHPNPDFEDDSKGEEAVRRLKEKGAFKGFAKHYKFTEAEVEELFRKDASAVLDKKGRLRFVEPQFIGSTTEAPGSNTNQTTIPLDQTFLLESKPGSSRTLYLDFNGHTATGTAWNSSYRINTINSPPFDLDGVPNTFSTAELQAIQGIWRRVAEDYAPFDINVTTRLISEDQLTRSTTADEQFGIRVVITRDFTKSTASPCNCGGFAYVGAFDNVGDANKPAYVFYDNLGSNEKSIAEAATHEAGHTVGLSHDGTTTQAYYAGHGTGVTAWAPIMGSGYNRNLVQWSKGEYAGANQTQDDYLVMQQNSLYFDEDEAGNTIATAKPLTFTTVNGLARYNVQATLQGPADVDVFEITAGAGALVLTADPQRTAPNLDIVMTLTNAAGTVLAQSNPAELLTAGINFNIPTSGKYYVSIGGTGKGDPRGTGYTDYGSVGTYTLLADAALPGTTAQPPNAVITTTSALTGNTPLTVNLSASQSTDDGSIASVQWNFGDGTTASGVNVSKTYNTAGNFTITLQVTDNVGLTDTDTVNVSAQQPVIIPLASVDGISMSGSRSLFNYTARATVTIRDQTGRVVPNATVRGTWSNRVSGTVSGVTNTSGVVTLTSPRATSGGTFVFTVNRVSATGFQYDASKNRLTSNSITIN